MATRYLPRARSRGSPAWAGMRGAATVSAATAATMVHLGMSLPNRRRSIERHTRLLLGWIMTDLVIRDATTDDVPAISALVQHTVRISNGRDYPPQAIEVIVANFAPAKVGQRMAERDVFVCQKGGRIVGTIALGGDRLRSLFVDPELQQAGIGARLVAHLEAHARRV